MPHIKYQGNDICTREGESVLEALLRHGISIPFSCRNGVCHVCLQRCVQGVVPPLAQRGLRPELSDQGYFMPCKCVPLVDIEIATPEENDSASLVAGNKTISPGQPVVTSEHGDKAKYPPPDPELWTALRNGELLMAALQDFYEKVFQDDRLSSFFHNVTKQRSVEKQFLFARRILTGEKIYMGDRPRNSHHWMVISNELFDYRAELMADCLRKRGLAEQMIQRFLYMEAFYRDDIVKSTPFAKVRGDLEVPYEGFGEITLDVGTLCDTCGREVSVGEKVLYHLRLGKVYCSDCSAQFSHELPRAA